MFVHLSGLQFCFFHALHHFGDVRACRLHSQTAPHWKPLAEPDFGTGACLLLVVVHILVRVLDFTLWIGRFLGSRSLFGQESCRSLNVCHWCELILGVIVKLFYLWTWNKELQAGMMRITRIGRFHLWPSCHPCRIQHNLSKWSIQTCLNNFATWATMFLNPKTSLPYQTCHNCLCQGHRSAEGIGQSKVLKENMMLQNVSAFKVHCWVLRKLVDCFVVKGFTVVFFGLLVWWGR